MSVRLNFIVDGQTEETFANQTLHPHLAAFGVWASARCVLSGYKLGVKHRGGIARYAQAKNDITRWIRQYRNPDARFTTMLDLYGLPTDFPAYEEARDAPNPYERVAILEEALENDIGDWRFLPYIQLHEFEALLLADPWKLAAQFLDSDDDAERLVDALSGWGEPELVDDGADTAPSKRIIDEIPAYEGGKVSAGPIIAGRIGIPSLRTRCPHFGEWLSKLEAISQSPA